MLIRVFYQKCPTCKQTWSAQLSQEPVIRIGRETFVCKCGTVWPTGRVEWAHLTPRMRRSYFFSTAEIGVLLLCPSVGGLFAFFIAGNRWTGMLWGLLGGLAVAMALILAMWVLKFVFARLSLRRSPPDLLLAPPGTGFFDLFRESLTADAGAPSSGSHEPELSKQIRSVRPISWVFASAAVAALPWLEYTWPVVVLSVMLFVRSLRKLRFDRHSES